MIVGKIHNLIQWPILFVELEVPIVATYVSWKKQLSF